MINKTQATYRVVFVPENGLDPELQVLAMGVGLNAAMAVAGAYHAQQWVGERTPELYGPVWQAGAAAIASLLLPEVYTVSVPVEYGAVVVL